MPWIDDAVKWAQILGAIATSGALWVMWRTLKEMQRQTTLANNPMLKMRMKISYDEAVILGNNVYFTNYSSEPHNHWSRIIENNLEGQNLSGVRDGYLLIRFTNSGKSEITEINCDVCLSVRMIENEFVTFIQPSEDRWSLSLETEMAERETIIVPITNIRYFPKYNCTIENIRYKDIRGKWHTEIDGMLEMGEKENEELIPMDPVEIQRMLDEANEMTDGLEMIDEDEIPF